MRLAAPLKALLSNLIDYAGLYPPASLPLEIVVERYRGFLASPDGWILNRLVLPLAKLPDVPPATPRPFRILSLARITLLVDDEPGPLPPQVETLETKGTRRLSLPTYCEGALSAITDAFAKVRTGGLTPESIPPAKDLADFLATARDRRLPFKATAGLHHPVRSMRALTYAPDSPRAMMHGFLNMFVAAAFAWHGAEREVLLETLNETEADAFSFGAKSLEWRGRTLSTEQIADARRNFAHSFGSCSFEEPIGDLRTLGLLP
jgi:hypothetical protein